MCLQLVPLKVKCHSGHRRGTGLSHWCPQAMEVGICQCLLAGWPLCRVECQHALQQSQGAPVCLAEVLLQLDTTLLAHVHQEAPCLLISDLQTMSAHEGPASHTHILGGFHSTQRKRQ